MTPNMHPNAETGKVQFVSKYAVSTENTLVPETAEIMHLLEDAGIYIYIRICICHIYDHICILKDCPASAQLIQNF